MARRGTPFAGLLYAGLALTSKGLRVVEFNCRFGDPETQAVLSLLESPLGEVLYAASTGTLDSVGDLVWNPGSAVIVVLAADGYPDTPARGGVIVGKRLITSLDNVHVVHAGTGLSAESELVADGGRVLGVVARAATLADARRDVYAAIDEIHFPSGFFPTPRPSGPGRPPAPRPYLPRPAPALGALRGRRRRRRTGASSWSAGW